MVALKGCSWTKKVAVTMLIFGFSILASGSATGDSSESRKKQIFGNKNTIRISIGTQDQVINTAVGGATVREMDLLQKYLPTTGKYEGAYGYGIAKNHPFIDGNKRTSYVVMRTFLKLNGYDIKASQSEKYQIWLQLADSQIDETNLAKWIEEKSLIIE